MKYKLLTVGQRVQVREYPHRLMEQRASKQTGKVGGPPRFVGYSFPDPKSPALGTILGLCKKSVRYRVQLDELDSLTNEHLIVLAKPSNLKPI